MRLLFLFLVISVLAQDSAPRWIEETWRAAHYPNAQWFTGFAVNKIESQPNAIAYETIEKEAQNKLFQSITVRIHSVSTTEQASTQTQSGQKIDETINRNYRQEITSTSNAVLAKLETHSHFDKKTGYIYGFAAVKKKDLADFYRSNINSLFSFAEKELVIIEVLAEQGKKNSAFGKIQAIEDTLKNVGYWGTLLQTAESDNSYIKREQDFWQKLSDAKKSLEHGTAIYLDISGIRVPEYFAEKLSDQMQEKGCNCTIAENSAQADYAVKIKARFGSCIEDRTNNFGFTYCYANANASVNNLKYKKLLDVKIPEAKGGWGNRNREKATDEAIKELINRLAEKIIQSINK